MASTVYAQYKNMEFRRLLKKIATERESSYHCKDETYETISKMLTTDYPEKDDDIDYLMDIINICLARKSCTDKKHFPISKYLDWACQNDLYIHKVCA